MIELSHSIASVALCLASLEMLSHRIFSHPRLCFSQIAKNSLADLDLPNFQLDLIWEDKERRSKYSNGWFYQSCPSPPTWPRQMTCICSQEQVPDTFAASHISVI